MNIIFDPVFQEWIDYRCQSMADALGQMAALIRSLNPEVVVEINPDGIGGKNNAWHSGVDHSRLLKYTQVFWAEDRTAPDYLPGGGLISTIRTYKLARTYQNIALTYISTSEAAIGECLAFNQTIGYAGDNPLSPETVKYISFYKKNRDLYTGTKDLASVAVLRSYPSITYHNSRTQLSAILVEQALIQAKVPFHLIFDEHLSDLSPAICKVLILPNSECLTDHQLALNSPVCRIGWRTDRYGAGRSLRPMAPSESQAGIAWTRRQSGCSCPLSGKCNDGGGRQGHVYPERVWSGASGLFFQYRVRRSFASTGALFQHRYTILEASEELEGISRRHLLGGTRRRSTPGCGPRFSGSEHGRTAGQATEDHSSGELQH